MGAEGDAPVTVHLRCSHGSKVSVQTALDATVGAFKRAIADKCDVPAEQQRLIYRGRILKDGDTLKSYGLEVDHTIHVVRGAAPPVVPTGTTATTTTNRGASLPPNNIMWGARDDSANESSGFGGAGLDGMLFPGIGVYGSGASGLFGFPELDQLHNQLIQNPSMLSELLNMPAVQSLINNPEVMRNLITNTPQLREIMDRNPDIAHVLNDPNMLRQTLEVARNPELMREMMRNMDRAMSNIESSPEGFNMLRRMYETIQEPFLNAAPTGNSINSNPFSSLFMNQGTNQSGDQMPNSLTTASDTATGPSIPNANPLPNPWSSSHKFAPSTRDAQTTNSRSSPAARWTSTIGGLGGLGLPELGRTSGGLPNLSLLNQVMQNPVVGQMMQNLLSDPNFMNQIFSFNPNSPNAAEPSSQFREMLSNPELIRQMASPEIQQQFQSLQQSLLSQIGRHQLNQEQHQAGGNSGASDVNGLELLTNMFGGLGGTDGLGARNTSNVPPEELYAAQLSQLQEMGFLDTQQNIRALSASGGNVQTAIERLLRDLGH